MLSTASFNALLKTLEEPPSHVIFIFATTNPEKIPKTVQSRCLQLNLKTVNEELLAEHIQKILKLEKINFDDQSTNMIANSAKGSVRDALTLLDQAIAHGNGELKEDEVKKLLGTIDDSMLIDLIDGVIDGDGKLVFNLLTEIEQLSPEYDSILENIISMLHQISLEQVLKKSDIDYIKRLSAKIDSEFCQLLYEIAMNAYSKFNVHPNPKEALEICLLRMLTFNPLHKLTETSASIPKEEKKNLKKDKSEELEKNIYTSKSLINSNKEWADFFNRIKMSPFARNYFGSMSFKNFDKEIVTLVSSEPIEIPKNIFLN
jgi:DNA polymerase III, gamma/tau subunits